MTAPRAFSLTDAEHHRIERVDRLVLLGAASVGELIAGLADPSWTVRRAVVAGLAALGDDAAGPLCAWLRDHRSSERAIAAAVEALSTSMGASVASEVTRLLGELRPAVVA
ncbi:MAG TPA: HEAT repeat domain-containing protein, partial [Kofleriaceae bacterium]|nr:HEAT repeat domain-containing protein [Kofleriaceae bacterium]